MSEDRYRIVKCEFVSGTTYQVQKMMWRQVPRRHDFVSIEEAKTRIEQLKAVKQRKQDVVYEDGYGDSY